MANFKPGDLAKNDLDGSVWEVRQVQGDEIFCVGKTPPYKGRTGWFAQSDMKKTTSPFSNGRQRAQQEITNKLRAAGVRVENAPGKFVMEYKGYHIQDYGNNKFVVFTHKGTGWAAATRSSVDEAKKFIDSHKLPQPGSRASIDGD